MDASNNRVLVADVVLEAIPAIDLATGDRSVVADAATGAGLDFAIAMTLDPTTGILLVVDLNVEALLAIDLLSGAGAVLSDATTGLGPFFSFPREVVLDAIRNRALIVDIARSEILGVDLASGDRAEFADSDTGTGSWFRAKFAADRSLSRHQLKVLTASPENALSTPDELSAVAEK